MLAVLHYPLERYVIPGTRHTGGVHPFVVIVLLCWYYCCIRNDCKMRDHGTLFE